MSEILLTVLPCVAVCCSVLQRVAVCCSVLQCVYQSGSTHTRVDVSVHNANSIFIKHPHMCRCLCAHCLYIYMYQDARRSLDAHVYTHIHTMSLCTLPIHLYVSMSLCTLPILYMYQDTRRSLDARVCVFICRYNQTLSYSHAPICENGMTH